MKKLKALVLIFALLIFGCNNQEKSENQDIQNTPKVNIKPSQDFILKINFATDQYNTVSIRQKNIVVDEFQTKNIVITEKIQPTSNDEITANFGEKALSKSLTIDLGRKTPQQFTVSLIELKYGNKTLIVTKDNLEKFFKLSSYIEYEKSTGLLKTVTKNGKLIPILTMKRNAYNYLIKK